MYFANKLCFISYQLEIPVDSMRVLSSSIINGKLFKHNVTFMESLDVFDSTTNILEKNELEIEKLAYARQF